MLRFKLLFQLFVEMVLLKGLKPVIQMTSMDRPVERKDLTKEIFLVQSLVQLIRQTVLTLEEVELPYRRQQYL